MAAETGNREAFIADINAILNKTRKTNLTRNYIITASRTSVFLGEPNKDFPKQRLVRIQLLFTQDTLQIKSAADNFEDDKCSGNITHWKYQESDNKLAYSYGGRTLVISVF